MLSILHLVCELAYWVIVFGLPWWICKRAGKLDNPFVANRFLKSVILVWAALVLFHFLIGRRVAWAQAQERGDLMYEDGLASIVGILFGGWIYGLFGTTISFLVYRLMQMGRNRNAQNVTKA